MPTAAKPALPRLRTVPALLLALALVAGCEAEGEITGFGDAVSACTAELEKAHVLSYTRDWYLYQEDLPPTVDPAAYDSADALLAALTAKPRADGRDRGWSFLASLSQSRAFNTTGASAGFGIQFIQPDASAARLFLSDVYEDAPAHEAGFRRGDEILAIGQSAAALAPLPTLLADDQAWADAIGPPSPGVTRTFQVRTAAGLDATRTMTKRSYALRPVPLHPAPEPGAAPVPYRLLDLPSGGKAGYVALRTFIGTADAQLREAFAAFGAAGVTRVVVDFRYNGGGLVSTATTLASLASAGRADQPMFRFDFNARHPEEDQPVPFGRWDRAEGRYVDYAEAIPATRVAFITTHGSASASELVPHVLDPYLEVALVGGKTYGKPVGQVPWDLEACDLAFYLVSFRLANSQGEGDYFAGLPDEGGAFQGPLCEAADDLGRALGDPAEASTAAALHWLDTGACPAPAPAALAASPRRVRSGAAVFPADADPTYVQRWIPGVY